jgi:hypothetical protein
MNPYLISISRPLLAAGGQCTSFLHDQYFVSRNFLPATVVFSVLHSAACSFRPHSVAYRILKAILMDGTITAY